MKEIRYCNGCKKDTEHEVTIRRDANNPPQSFIEAEEEGYISSADCIFYANGDSEYQVICLVCHSSYINL